MKTTTPRIHIRVVVLNN